MNCQLIYWLRWNSFWCKEWKSLAFAPMYLQLLMLLLFSRINIKLGCKVFETISAIHIQKVTCIKKINEIYFNIIYKQLKGSNNLYYGKIITYHLYALIKSLLLKPKLVIRLYYSFFISTSFQKNQNKKIV